jgi:hypothetical protein
VKTGNPHQVKHGNCNLITNKISIKVHYLSEKNDRHLWLRSDKLLYRFCVIGNQISEIEENNMYLESMNVTKQRYLIQFVQTFVDLAIARFPPASSSVPQQSGLSNQKAIS